MQDEDQFQDPYENAMFDVDLNKVSTYSLLKPINLIIFHIEIQSIAVSRAELASREGGTLEEETQTDGGGC